MRAHGFTLLELLVAISIFSILGLGSYQLLQSVGDSHARVRDSINSYIKLNQALTTIQRDFNQFLPRPVRDEYGEPLLAITFEGEDYLVEFTRGGWPNPSGRPRSELQRVAYNIDYDEKVLTRYFWLVLDRAEDSEPVVQKLLEGVTDFQINGVMTNAERAGDLATEEASAGTPAGVELVIATEKLGDVRRIFQLVEPYREVDGDSSERKQQEVDLDNSASPIAAPADAPSSKPGIS